MLPLQNIRQSTDRFLSIPTVRMFALLMMVLGVGTLTKMLQHLLILDMITTMGLYLALITVTVWSFRAKDAGAQWWAWATVAACMAVYILRRWPLPANHSYVYMYLSLALMCVFLNRPADRLRVLRVNTLLLIAVVMLFAVVQKVLTPGYLDGSLNAFRLANGDCFRPVYSMVHHWGHTVELNDAALNQYYNVRSESTGQLHIQSPVEHLRFWSLVFTYAVLAAEILVPIVFAFGKNPVLKHGAMLLFVPLVFLARQESGFLSLLCIMAMAHCASDQKRLRAAYLFCFFGLQTMFLLDLGYV